MTEHPDGYQVLARKYRPQDFSALVGQEAMVRVLRNAFSTGRIHHAYLLTGVRGVGKTTTARIIAKGLNCIGPDGTGGPTVEPCGVCDPCKRITESRHVDVIEMDAASNTGIDDIREIIEGARYRAASARYKVYIIDEVHMLSKSAFNGLLKTLEEPPAHVKFLFATTEIRKVPVTVLSRCQRFDLRRIEPDRMIAYLGDICAREGAKIGAEALTLVSRAAEGSMRDALSLLDQAIANAGGAEASAADIRAMLGLADRGRVLDLFALIMKGEAAAALKEIRDQYDSGADPAAVLRDLAETTHWISTLKIAADAAADPTLPPDERRRGAELAGGLSMRALTRAWQMLLKSLEEVERAPAPIQAAEMAVIRLCCVADLPSPEEILRRLQDDPGGAPAPRGGGGGGGSGGAAQAMSRAPMPHQAPRAAPMRAPEAALPQTFEAVAALAKDKRDLQLHYDIEHGLRLIAYAPGRIEFTPAANAPATLAGTLKRRLEEWTGGRWAVIVAEGGTAQTLAEKAAAEKSELTSRISEDPAVKAALLAFPGAEIMDVRPLAPMAAPSAPVDPDDWDEDEEGMIFDPFGDD